MGEDDSITEPGNFVGDTRPSDLVQSFCSMRDTKTPDCEVSAKRSSRCMSNTVV